MTLFRSLTGQCHDNQFESKLRKKSAGPTFIGDIGVSYRTAEWQFLFRTIKCQ